MAKRYNSGVKIFEEYNNRGTVQFIKWLFSLTEEQLHLIQLEYFYNPIKKDKDKQVEKIYNEVTKVINAGKCFR